MHKNKKNSDDESEEEIDEEEMSDEDDFPKTIDEWTSVSEFRKRSLKEIFPGISERPVENLDDDLSNIIIERDQKNDDSFSSYNLQNNKSEVSYNLKDDYELGGSYESKSGDSWSSEKMITGMKSDVHHQRGSQENINTFDPKMDYETDRERRRRKNIIP